MLCKVCSKGQNHFSLSCYASWSNKHVFNVLFIKSIRFELEPLIFHIEYIGKSRVLIVYSISYSYPIFRNQISSYGNTQILRKYLSIFRSHIFNFAKVNAHVVTQCSLFHTFLSGGVYALKIPIEWCHMESKSILSLFQVC